MEDMTMIGLVLLIIGVVLAPFTCLISLLTLSLIGIILIIVGETQPKTYPPPYAPPYPTQPYQHRPYPPPTRVCPTCGAPMRWVQQYNNWYCDYCRSYR
jgi:hypothetical protein